MRRATAILAVVGSFAAAPALAQNEAGRVAVCLADLQLLATRLEASWAEVPVAAGLGQDGSLMSTFASPASGSWTLVLTRPGGPSCIVAAGQGFMIEPAAFGPKA